MRPIRAAAEFRKRFTAAGTIPEPLAETLRENMSFVLHDHSASDVVRRTAQTAFDNARQFREAGVTQLPVTGEVPTTSADIWLTATIGSPSTLERLALKQPTMPSILRVDTSSTDMTTCGQFFRAQAALTLPRREAAEIFVVGALTRPGGKSLELACRGPFHWPEQKDETLRALEWLIRTFVEQWCPQRRLWAGPAERLLPPGEIVAPEEDPTHR